MHSNLEKYHLIGIGGIGMSGIAHLLLGKGKVVSGSDLLLSEITDELVKRGVNIAAGHDGSHVPKGATVVFSGDIKSHNPEYLSAKEMGCQLLHRSEMLKQLMEEKISFAVTGTHGKTTTSSLLAKVLHQAGLDPSFCVGGILADFGSNAQSGKGNYFVAEADESDGSVLRYHPTGAIVTNIDLDHMDYFKDEAALVRLFQQFFNQVTDEKFLFWCLDDTRLSQIANRGVSYGFHQDANCRCSNFRQEGWYSYFDLEFEGKRYSDIALHLIGRHNVLNGAAVFGMAIRCGVPESCIREAFYSFKGTGRRMENRGEHHSVLFLDDYAHHPKEISVTLHAIREKTLGRRLVVLFQPHRYTRTQECMDEFGPAFIDADELFITDVYGAGEAAIPGVDSKCLTKAIQNSVSSNCRYIPKESFVEVVNSCIQPKDVVVSLGAGDITKLGKDVLERFKKDALSFF